jgi:hypothetical protein
MFQRDVGTFGFCDSRVSIVSPYLALAPRVGHTGLDKPALSK